MSVYISRFLSFLLFCIYLCVYSFSSIAQTEVPPPKSTVLPSYEGFDSILERAIESEAKVPQKKTPGMQLPSTGLPAVEEEPEVPISEAAFEAAITGLLPLDPEQIRAFLEHFDETQDAVKDLRYAIPSPVNTIDTVSLDPGVAPLQIKTAVGYVTTLNFIDVTGEKWPIQDMGWAGEYQIIQPEDSSHIIRVTPLSEFGQGNISVRLVGLKTPIILTLTTARDQVHYRADLRIPELGPNATPPILSLPISTVAGGKDMSAILTGVIPDQSEKLIVSGLDSRTSAYVLEGATYVRTPHILLSPGWMASVKSSDGTTVYQIGDAPVLLMSDNGRIVRAYLKKKEAIDGL